MGIDTEEVMRFIGVLPDLTEDTCYLLMLIARSRYIKEFMGIKAGDTVLERAVIPMTESWREQLYRKIIKFSFLMENSKKLYEIHDVPVDPRALGIMIVINQSKIRSAYIDFISQSLKRIILEEDWHGIAKLHVLWFSTLHRRSGGALHRIDIDVKQRDIIGELEEALLEYGGWWIKIETRRGYHYIIDLRRIDTKNFFGKFRREVFPELRKKLVDPNGIPLLDYGKNPIEPIPGTLYGGFRVRLIDIRDGGEQAYGD